MIERITFALLSVNRMHQDDNRQEKSQFVNEAYKR